MTQRMNVPALKQQWVLDAQWTDCPEEVEKEIKDLWRFHELGNDHYMLRRSISDLIETSDQGFEVEEWDNVAVEWKKAPLKVDNLISYLKDKGISEDEQVIIHWWW